MCLGAFSPVHLADCAGLSFVNVGPREDEWWDTSNLDAGIYRGRITDVTEDLHSDGTVIKTVQLAFNDSQMRSWQYEWQRPDAKPEGHCFVVHVLRVVDLPDDLVGLNFFSQKQHFSEIYSSCSPTFHIVSARNRRSRMRKAVANQAGRDDCSENSVIRAHTLPPRRPLVAGASPFQCENTSHRRAVAQGKDGERVVYQPPRGNTDHHRHPHLSPPCMLETRYD